MMAVILSFLAAALTAFLLTPLVRRWALARHITDDPAIEAERRMHAHPTALLGGLAVWLSIALVSAFLLLFNSPLIAGQYLKLKFIIGIIAAGGVLMVGGYLDDRYRLPPYLSILFPIIAAALVIMSGAGINFITRPWGGVWRLDSWKIELFRYNGLPYYFNVWADLLVFGWLMAMMYTTKLLDGLDGLASGIAAIGALTLTALSFSAAVHQPDTALFSALMAGAFIGFLYYNWPPASIFLGEGGSLLAGLMLGSLAIAAGGKIATTVLVVGVPLLDLVWVILRRLFWDRSPLTAADRKHLHFRLLDAGLSVRQAVCFFWFFSALLGIIALMAQTRGKVLAILVLLIVFCGAAYFIVRRQRGRAF